jgi:hypothetical protein
MDPLAVFGFSVLMSLISSVAAATLLVWPWLRAKSRRDALLWLVTPHMFLRFLGLSFLVPGVVSELLPKAWAVPAAYGDCAAGILAIIAVGALSRTASWAIVAVWIFNSWGAADFLFAMYQGPRVHLVPGWLGAGFYVVTAIVPPLLISHALIFRELRRPAA